MVRPPGDSVLMIGFHFPPCAISSGHLRLLSFTRYLPEFGWHPVVLSATDGAYEKVDLASTSAIPTGTPVHRAFALDARRHLGIRGRYPSMLAQPDRWVSWWPTAVMSGLRLIKRHHVRAIWSTYPIMTAHCVAYSLSRMTGIPWIADFRDPVASTTVGKNKMTVNTQKRWERRIAEHAACSVFTSLGASQAFAECYPAAFEENRISVIPNGFDEPDFVGLHEGTSHVQGRPLHFIHGGVLYGNGRDPTAFFEALANLKSAGLLTGDDIRITLRASGSEDLYAAKLDRLGLDDMVTLAPSLPYRQSLAEQAQADGLLLFQGSQFDHQIPAKLYEYLRLGKPIFAMVGEQGDTAALVRRIPNAVIAPLDVAGTIEKHFAQFARDVGDGVLTGTTASDVGQYSRHHAAGQLAQLLRRVSATAVDAPNVPV